MRELVSMEIFIHKAYVVSTTIQSFSSYGHMHTELADNKSH